MMLGVFSGRFASLDEATLLIEAKSLDLLVDVVLVLNSREFILGMGFRNI